MTGPEFLTHAEEKQLAKIIETDIDHAIEQAHIHEVVNEDVCFNCEHGKEHHQHADACRYETCQCKCWE